MKIIGMLGISLLLLALGCPRQASHEPVTLTFLDVEWDTPDLMPRLAQGFAGVHTGNWDPSQTHSAAGRLF